jgi:hypothetical protein
VGVVERQNLLMDKGHCVHGTLVGAKSHKGHGGEAIDRSVRVDASNAFDGSYTVKILG